MGGGLRRCMLMGVFEVFGENWRGRLWCCEAVWSCCMYIYCALAVGSASPFGSVR